MVQEPTASNTRGGKNPKYCRSSNARFVDGAFVSPVKGIVLTLRNSASVSSRQRPTATQNLAGKRIPADAVRGAPLDGSVRRSPALGPAHTAISIARSRQVERMWAGPGSSERSNCLFYRPGTGMRCANQQLSRKRRWGLQPANHRATAQSRDDDEKVSGAPCRPGGERGRAHHTWPYRRDAAASSAKSN